MLALYRRVLALRRSSPALRRGHQESVDLGEEARQDVVAWRRWTIDDEQGEDRDDELIIAVNFGGADVPVDVRGHIVEGSHRRDVRFDGRLRPDEAIILRL